MFNFLSVAIRPTLNSFRVKVMISLHITQTEYKTVCSSPNAVFLTEERLNAVLLVSRKKLLRPLGTQPAPHNIVILV